MDSSEPSPKSDRPADTNLGPIAVLTGGGDRPYALGLGACLIEQGISFDFIASDELEDPALRRSKLVNFLNLRGDQTTTASFVAKILRVLWYYLRLSKYAAFSRAKVFHLLWHNKFQTFDRTVLIGYYKLLGKRLVFTAHNVNAGKRDGNDSAINRWALRYQYRKVDHILVHTPKMKQELADDFGIPESKVSVIPFGINSTVPDTELTTHEARAKLGLLPQHKAILFFGNIAPYKGLEFLVEAAANLVKQDPDYRLIVVGRPKNCDEYWAGIRSMIDRHKLQPYIIERIEFVPDEETELFFKAADVLILPYTHIFQSGVLFLGFNFGLPVIASDVGSLKDDITIGETGFVCRPKDAGDLTAQIAAYFASNLYRNLPASRQAIRRQARERYSWTRVGEITRQIYAALLQ